MNRSIRAFVLALFLAGCTAVPETSLRGPPGHALAPAPGGVIAAAETKLRKRLGPDQSGFHLLDSNEDGLRWRLALVDAAQHSIDLQYYIWLGDASGDLLLKHVLDAADRGVRVRIIVDDLSTMLEDEGHLALRDERAARVDSHPNIELRLFNAWHSRPIAGRLVDSLARMDRVNHRMHNKLLVADNRAAVIGGRNVGDHYFGLSDRFNFRDLDVLGIGPVARQASSAFDRFWNSGWLLPASALGIAVTERERASQQASLRAKLYSNELLVRFPLEPRDWQSELTALTARMHAGTSRVHTDTPDADAVHHHMPGAIRELLATAHREVLIMNAYIIPGEHALERMREGIANGIRYRMLTNSLASHDVPAVNSHYKQWRRPLVDAGVELYELRPDAAVQSQLVDTPPARAEFTGLHAKAIVIDETRVFIGSMNLDPRSWGVNSEMGVVIESPDLARSLASAIRQDMHPDNAWRVMVAPDGDVLWIAGDDIRTTQPARSLWQRFEDVVFMLFPSDLY